MSVLAMLAKEHRLFERLIRRLDDGAELPAPIGLARVESALRLLLPALERHDRVEEAAFGAPNEEWDEDSRRAHEIVAAQHDTLRQICAEVALALGEAQQPSFLRLRSLALQLAAKLQWHFKTEELLLWPLHAKAPGRSLGRSLEHEAAKSVAALQAELAEVDSSLEP